ncbi:MAG: hypothetical protein WC483_02885 [Candidatus Paceibacterota bacterium]
MPAEIRGLCPCGRVIVVTKNIFKLNIPYLERENDHTQEKNCPSPAQLLPKAPRGKEAGHRIGRNGRRPCFVRGPGGQLFGRDTLYARYQAN